MGPRRPEIVGDEATQIGRVERRAATSQNFFSFFLLLKVAAITITIEEGGRRRCYKNNTIKRGCFILIPLPRCGRPRHEDDFLG